MKFSIYILVVWHELVSITKCQMGPVPNPSAMFGGFNVVNLSNQAQSATHANNGRRVTEGRKYTLMFISCQLCYYLPIYE